MNLSKIITTLTAITSLYSCTNTAHDFSKPADTTIDGIVQQKDTTFGESKQTPQPQCWEKTFGGKKDESLDLIQQTADEGYIATGSTDSKGADDELWILKLDSKGDLQWEKTFGGEGHYFVHSIQQTKESGYIATGTTNSKGTSGYEGWILKLDSKGDLCK